MLVEYAHYSLILRSDGHSLYLGDMSSAQDTAFLSNYKIKTTAAGMSHLKFDANIRHIHYEMLDGKKQKIGDYLQHAALQIDKLGSVLVHCAAGVSRSATLVIAYLIKCKGMKFSEALKLCKSRRPQVCPNLGFQMQLKALQLRLNSKSGSHYRELRERSSRQLKYSMRLSNISQMNQTHHPSFFPSFDYSLPRQMIHSNLDHSLPPVVIHSVNQQKKDVQGQAIKKVGILKFRLTHMDNRIIRRM